MITNINDICTCTHTRLQHSFLVANPSSRVIPGCLSCSCIEFNLSTDCTIYNHRPTWDEYFLSFAKLASTRATCPRAHCGVVLVKDHRILATGYNGSPPGEPHCEDVGCELEGVDNMIYTTEGKAIPAPTHCIRVVHSEANAIAQAAKFGIPVEGATAYVYDSEYNQGQCCRRCLNLLASVGITNIIYSSENDV